MTIACKTGEDFAVEFNNEMIAIQKIVQEQKFSFKRDNAF